MHDLDFLTTIATGLSGANVILLAWLVYNVDDLKKRSEVIAMKVDWLYSKVNLILGRLHLDGDE
jgi:hypothetical protein